MENRVYILGDFLRLRAGGVIRLVLTNFLVSRGFNAFSHHLLDYLLFY